MGGHTQHLINVEDINKEKHTYTKAVDIRRLFKGTNLHLLLLIWPRGHTLHSPEKSKNRND